MAQEFATGFYNSKAWKDCRAGYLRSVGGLCERCLAKGTYRPAEIIHHKIHLTPANISNPDVALSWDNLEALCRDCHAEIHEPRARRYKLDEMGRVITK